MSDAQLNANYIHLRSMITTTETAETLAREIAVRIMDYQRIEQINHEMRHLGLLHIIQNHIAPTFAKLTAAEKALGECALKFEEIDHAGEICLNEHEPYILASWKDVAKEGITLAKQHLSS